MSKRIEISGKKFGRLTVLHADEESSKNGRHIKWYAKCDCGVIKPYTGKDIRNGHVKSCGCLKIDKCKNRIGKNHPAWRGGRHIDKDSGYVRIKKPNHPNCNMRGYIKEHIFIMSEHIGRPLKKHELVHHKNRIKDDNRIENLELCTIKKHPPGQKVIDMVEFCKEVLFDYKKESLNEECINSIKKGEKNGKKEKIRTNEMFTV